MFRPGMLALAVQSGKLCKVRGRFLAMDSRPEHHLHPLIGRLDKNRILLSRALSHLHGHLVRVALAYDLSFVRVKSYPAIGRRALENLDAFFWGHHREGPTFFSIDA